MNHKLIEIPEAEYAALFVNHKPGYEPNYIQLCRAGGNMVLLASAVERGLLLDLPRCMRPIANRWAGIEWIYSAPTFPGINPLSQYAKSQGYSSVTQFAEDHGLNDW